MVDPKRRYVFLAPWPWHEVDPALLSGGNALGAPADICLTAPRTDGDDPLFTLVARDEKLSLEDLNPKTFLHRLLVGSTQQLDEVHHLYLDGRRALLGELTSRSTRDAGFLLVAPHSDWLVDGYGHAPASSARGYLTHIMSMLASWRWAP